MESSEVVREKEHPFAKKRWIIAVTLVVLTILGLFYGLFAGSLSFSVRDILTGIQDEGSTVHRIVWDLRIPRVLVGFIVGTCLAASGTLLQGVMKPSCRSWYYRSFIWGRPCSNCHHDFIPTASSFYH